MATKYDISENNPLNLFLAVMVVAFTAYSSGRILTNVFSSAPAEAAVVQLGIVIFISRAVTQMLTKLKFHPEVATFAKDVFGPLMWGTQAATLANVTGLFSRVVPV